MTKKIRLFIKVCFFVSFIGFSANSTADSFRYAVGFPPGSIGDETGKVLSDAFSKYTDGEHNLKVFAMSLLNLAETPKGISSGLVDGGFVILPYVFSDFPATNFLLELAMSKQLLEADPEVVGPAFMAASTEFILSQCPECLEEFDNQNHVFTGYAASSNMVLLCKGGHFNTLESLSGAKIRVGGGPWRRWITEVGAQPVNISLNETYEALEQGVVDCTTSPIAELSSLRLHEVVDSIVVNAPAGPGGGISINSFNKKAWSGLTEEERESLFKAGLEAAVYWTRSFANSDLNNIEASKSQWNIDVLEASDDLRSATLKFSVADIVGSTNRFRENYGVSDSGKYAEKMQGLLEKWVSKFEGETDPDVIVDMIWSEIDKKVDFRTYGL